MTIADDYSDPFDAKSDLKNKAGKGESAGYMEPYEAQRIMTGEQSAGVGFQFVFCCCDRIPESGPFIICVIGRGAFVTLQVGMFKIRQTPRPCAISPCGRKQQANLH